jgi:sugar/nucleoside kinase (ribokinase family)
MHVTLSMNENEIQHLHKVLTGKTGERGSDSREIESYAEMLAALAVVIPASSLVLHLADSSLSMDESGQTILVKNHYIEEPRILIGGGDNYNAGYCYGLLDGEKVRECMALAGATSSYYVQHGQSPTQQALSAYLAQLEG